MHFQLQTRVSMRKNAKFLTSVALTKAARMAEHIYLDTLYYSKS